MEERNNICLEEVKLIEAIRLEAKVPLVWLFRVRVGDVLRDERRIIFTTKYGAKKTIKLSYHLFNRVLKHIDSNVLFNREYLFFSKSIQNPINKSRYFTILWNKRRLEKRPKIKMPNIDEGDNEYPGFLLHTESKLSASGKQQRASMPMD